MFPSFLCAQTMCTTVAKLFTTEAPAHSTWIKRNTGALCFVRDSAKRSYFMRMYCLARSELVWEEEMYDAIYINQSKEWLIDFEGRVSSFTFLQSQIIKSLYKKIQPQKQIFPFSGLAGRTGLCVRVGGVQLLQNGHDHDCESQQTASDDQQ